MYPYSQGHYSSVCVTSDKVPSVENGLQQQTECNSRYA